MNEIVNFFLPLTFGHIFYVALIVIAAIVCARIALALVIWLGSFVIGAVALMFVGLFAVFNRPKKRRIRR
jgi:uncharacterized membrane protein YgaE (UPF0421/DUF939 family)